MRGDRGHFEHIIIADSESGRLHENVQFLSDFFHPSTLDVIEWNKRNPEEDIKTIKMRCSELYQQRCEPLVISNIAGLRNGMLNTALQATRHRMQGILATCYYPDMVFTTKEIYTPRILRALLTGRLKYVRTRESEKLQNYCISQYENIL